MPGTNARHVIRALVFNPSIFLGTIARHAFLIIANAGSFLFKTSTSILCRLSPETTLAPLSNYRDISCHGSLKQQQEEEEEEV